MKDDHEGGTQNPPSEPEVLPQLVNQLLGTLWQPRHLSDEDKTRIVESAVQRVMDIQPRDPVESMLAVQMVATHEAAMECLRRSMMEEQPPPGRDLNLKHATKLMSLYERQAAAFDKRRGGGQQNVTVKYVHVAEGGQAIVGNVTHNDVADSAAAQTTPQLAARYELPLELRPVRRKRGEPR